MKYIGIADSNNISKFYDTQEEAEAWASKQLINARRQAVYVATVVCTVVLEQPPVKSMSGFVLPGEVK